MRQKSQLLGWGSIVFSFLRLVQMVTSSYDRKVLTSFSKSRGL
jgi:hypothetical protein